MHLHCSSLMMMTRRWPRNTVGVRREESRGTSLIHGGLVHGRSICLRLSLGETLNTDAGHLAPRRRGCSSGDSEFRQRSSRSSLRLRTGVWAFHCSQRTLSKGFCPLRFFSFFRPMSLISVLPVLSTSYPLMLKILCVLRMLGRGEVADSCAESTNMSEDTIRVFFHEFCARTAETLFDDVIQVPKTEAEIRKVEAQYRSRGMPGCLGSVDCVHVAWEKCPYLYRNLFIGKEGFPTVTFEVRARTLVMCNSTDVSP